MTISFKLFDFTCQDGGKNQYNDNVRCILVKQKIKLHNLLTDLSSKTFFYMNVVDKMFF